jgi:hypothetical protein
METILKEKMIEILGQEKTEKFFTKLINLANTDPKGFKSKLNLADTLIK